MHIELLQDSTPQSEIAFVPDSGKLASKNQKQNSIYTLIEKAKQQ
jgi:hypothetical protein